jgi:hypothetical protein
MYFVLRDDIETTKHYPSGTLLNMVEMTELLSECDAATADCFLTMDAANEWITSQS